jgi:hypothetical protein
MGVTRLMSFGCMAKTVQGAGQPTMVTGVA